MSIYSHDRVKGFLHAQNGIMVNGDGEEVILRGWGMGNWDNPEAFMLGIQSDFAIGDVGKWHPMGRMDRGRSMDLILRETCGTKYAAEFWPKWRRAYLNESDIRLLSERGYNSVRLPIRACSFLKEEPGIEFDEDSFAMLTDVLDWCEKYRVYAIIDLHAATAGQSCLPCDDGVDNALHFFDDEESMERMQILMEEFAKRYCDRWIVGGYDCINEPLSITPRREPLTPALREFYMEMVRRMRVFDKNHMMLLNGTQFSSIVDVFDRDFDPECHNWGISIHMYSMVSPEMVSVSEAIRTCRALNVPLWMGETGSTREYNWQTTMYELLAEHHTGFNLWCWKVCEGADCASTMNFKVPEEWHLITDYALRGGAKPGYAHAQRIWNEYLECVKFENCTEDASYHPYVLREGSFDIPAIGFNDLPADSHSYANVLPCVTGYRLSDRMEIVYEQGFSAYGMFPGMPPQGHVRDHMHLKLSAGEFASYSVRTAGKYAVGAAYCAEAPAKVRVTAGENVLFEGVIPAAKQHKVEGNSKNFPNEPAANALTEFTFGETCGEQVIRLEVLEGCAEFGSILIREA